MFPGEKPNEENLNLSNFLPSNVLSELDENNDNTNIIKEKESNVIEYFY